MTKRSHFCVEGVAYEGEFQEDKRHGYGEFKWVDSRIYKGMWKNGKGYSTILVCILMFVFDQLILY